MSRLWCLVVLVLGQCPSALATSTPTAAFQAWMQAHHKTYASPAEQAERYGHWLRAYNRVEAHGTHPHYALGLNEWSDLSPAEHQQRLLSASAFRVPTGWRKRFVDEFAGGHPRVFEGQEGHDPPPPEVDWRDPGKNPKGVRAVTSVRNQYLCGGCYSFATVAAVEGVVAADQGYLNELSDEQVIDCDAANHGCQGGDPRVALQVRREEGGRGGEKGGGGLCMNVHALLLAV